MKRFALIAGLAVAACFPASAFAASECKGKPQDACAAATACTWRTEVKAGDMTKKGTPAIRSTKAHCRKK